MNRRLRILLVSALALAAFAAAVDTPRPAELKPPIAERKAHAVVSPNGTRDNPYYWLRDDTRSKPEVLGYLKAENAYYEARSAAYQDLTEALSKEIIGRLKQDDSSVPYKYKNYVYYCASRPGRSTPSRRAIRSTRRRSRSSEPAGREGRRRKVIARADRVAVYFSAMTRSMCLSKFDRGAGRPQDEPA